jgi:hypothetical protein
MFSLESTIAVAQQNADIHAEKVGGNEIEFAVAVEVGDGYGIGLESRAEVLLWLGRYRCRCPAGR